MIKYEIIKDESTYVVYKIVDSPFRLSQIIGIAYTKYGAKRIMKKDIKKRKTKKNKIFIGCYNEYGEEINE